MSNKNSPGPSHERAIYGFVMYMSSTFALCLYLIWAYLPKSWLHYVGLTYWPQKYWALAVPVYCSVCVPFLYFFYTAYNFTITLPLDSINTMQDIHSRAASHVAEPSLSIPQISDIPISEVNKLLYRRPKQITESDVK
ncbi:phosphatidylinositol N-acetylglucosaminyltransferase subunit P-like [Antedon mediterranea]|uniref:phosphatidylinositol N-acetylglucosaminyltransferase subunit P-like n=1 Tax=Antedon mediterranea TaxID=105859 RepID=UPI003AF5B4B6